MPSRRAFATAYRATWSPCRCAPVLGIRPPVLSMKSQARPSPWSCGSPVDR
jgi:hypothetical protein